MTLILKLPLYLVMLFSMKYVFSYKSTAAKSISSTDDPFLLFPNPIVNDSFEYILIAS